MSTGDEIYQAGEAMSGYYEGVIKSCAVAIAPPALTFGLSVQSLATSIYMNQCNPGDMIKSAGAWIKLAEKNFEAMESLGGQTDRVGDDNWKGEDAEAFKDASDNIQQQLGELAVTAFLIGAQLIALAVALTIYWVFLFACTVTMGVFLAAYVAAYAGVVTSVGAEAIRTSCVTVATAFCSTVKAFEATIRSISAGCAALTAGLSGITFVFQKAHGNPVSPMDIAGSGLTNMLLGLGTFAERSLTMTPGGRHAAVTGGTAFRHGVQTQGGFGVVDSLASNFYDGDENVPDVMRDPTGDEINWTE
ncbi:hypothetical protein GCM10027447_03830 [Glycomyces halotolerans]